METEMWLTRRRRLERRRGFIESYAFPPALPDKLGGELEDERAVALALEGLRAWYLACLWADRKTLGMPSRAVDVAWHEMILMTREYHAFCDRAFGHYLHHSPEALEPMVGLVGRSRRGLCGLERLLRRRRGRLRRRRLTVRGLAHAPAGPRPTTS
jgi:hypothetical protein